MIVSLEMQLPASIFGRSIPPFHHAFLALTDSKCSCLHRRGPIERRFGYKSQESSLQSIQCCQLQHSVAVLVERPYKLTESRPQSTASTFGSPLLKKSWIRLLECKPNMLLRLAHAMLFGESKVIRCKLIETYSGPWLKSVSIYEDACKRRMDLEFGLLAHSTLTHRTYDLTFMTHTSVYVDGTSSSVRRRGHEPLTYNITLEFCITLDSLAKHHPAAPRVLVLDLISADSCILHSYREPGIDDMD